MDQERAKRIRELFDEAANTPAAERSAFLGGRDEDPVIVAEVEELLRHLESARTEAFQLAPAPRSLEGNRIGPYRLREKLGEGGMGVVYRAEREDIGLEAALKLVRAGRLASGGDIGRFILERRILARLQHPGIARLLDAGITEDGLPYFVMELVRGERIDLHCDAHRLTIDDRLRLFVDVCEAVQFAHRNLIVHRDLKPSNVLVTPEGTPGLLDFGVARLLHEDERGLTEAGIAPLTPAYAAPEQFTGGVVTTATDVYALGAILYELLTGLIPFRVPLRGAAAIVEAVRFAPAIRPSVVVRSEDGMGRREGVGRGAGADEVAAARGLTPVRLGRRLAGDLDTIVLHALEKEPERRYHSAADLADDVRRHLAGQTIRARPATLRYRAGKFARRNRTAVTVAALLMLSLIAGLGATLWQAREAARQRDLAVEAAHAMIDELAYGLSRMEGPTDARRGLLAGAVEVFRRVGPEGGLSPELSRHSIEARRRLAQTYWLLGDTAEARRFAAEAERQARRLAGRPKASREDRLLLVGTLAEKGDVLSAAGQPDSALAAYAEAIARVQPLARTPAAGTDIWRAHYVALYRAADLLWEHRGQVDSAAALYDRAHRASLRLLEADPSNPQFAGFHALALDRTGDVLWARDSVPEACDRYRTATDVRRRTIGGSPDDVEHLRALANGIQNVAWCHQQEGDVAGAVERFTEANGILRRLLSADPANTLLASLLLGGIGELGNTLRAGGDMEGALAAYREALAVGDTTLARTGGAPNVSWPTARMAQLLADALVAVGRQEEADQALGRARGILESLAARMPDNVEIERALADLASSAGEADRTRSAFVDAVAHYGEAVARRRKVAAMTDLGVDWQEVARAELGHALALEGMGRVDDAHAALMAARKVLRDLKGDGRLADGSEGALATLPAVEAALDRLGS